MSRENVKKFYELAEKDVDLAQKLARLDNEMSLEASDLAHLKDIVNEKIIPLAKSKGLDFTAEEMVDFANEKYFQLSEDDLLEVSGGVSPKAAGLALSSVLLLSLCSAAAINLMNSNHDNISNVVSEPSKTASEEKEEGEEEEKLKKDIDEMLKKLPKEKGKDSQMEDIEKELDKLFKGGKLGGGSAFRPGNGRAAGKNMLNRTIGKKGTSDFDFDKFLKELNDELSHEAATPQKPIAPEVKMGTSDVDFDKFMEELESEKKSETGPTRTATPDVAPIEDTIKPAPISNGTPKKATDKNEKKKITRKKEKSSPQQKLEQQKEQQRVLEEALRLRTSPTKEQVETEKKQIQQKINTKLTDFKANFEKRFKETYETQCNEKDLASFVKNYLYNTISLDASSINSGTTVTFSLKVTSSGEVITKSEDILDFAKELNDALPKMQYKPVNRRASWKDVMSHVMGALQEAKYDLSKFDPDAMKELKNDIDWICTSINKDGYLPATLSANYGKDANSMERKNIEYLKALKDSLYNKDDAKVQAALKALGENIHEEPVKKPDASGVGQERIESEKKEEEERLRKEADEKAKKEAEEKARKQKEEQERIEREKAEEKYKQVDKSSSWQDVIVHVMSALLDADYDIGKLNGAEQVNLKNDINWICSKMKQSDGTYYLGASALLGGAVRSKYGWDTKNPTLENRELEFLQALKTANYNKNDEKVQAAINALYGDETKEEAVEKPLAGATPHAEKDAPFTFENQEDAKNIVDDLVNVIKRHVEDDFKNIKTQRSEEELQQITDDAIKRTNSDPKLSKTSIVGNSSVKFFAKGQLKDGTEVEAIQNVNVFELVKELNSKLPKAGVEDAKKDGTEKPQEELIVSDINKPDAGGVSLSKGEATKLVSEHSGFLPLDFTAGQQAVTLVKSLKKLGNVKNLKLVDKKDRALLAQNIKHIYDQIKTDKSGKPHLKNFYNWSISADDLNLVEQAFEIVKDDFVQEKLKEKPVVKSDAGATVTTAKELQKQADAQKSEAETKLNEGFKAKIAANNGIELNEANLNKLISETLNSYKVASGDTINFTLKKTIPGRLWGTRDVVGSATLDVKEFFTKLNNEATEDRRESERSSFVHTKYVTATEADVNGGLKLARNTAKEMIQEEFNKIIVAKYNAKKPAKKATSVVDIPAGKMAAIVNSLRLDDVVARIVAANLNKVDDFKIKDAKKLNGQFSIKTAAANEELKIGAIGYKLTGVIGFRQPELIKYGDEISIREEAEKLIKESVETYIVSYKTVKSILANTEVDNLFDFLKNKELIKDDKVVDNVLDAIKDSDKKQFKEDVRHIASQISGGEGSYSLQGKLLTYKNVEQNKLKAIKDLATQLGV